jgi:hypothetical protein
LLSKSSSPFLPFLTDSPDKFHLVSFSPSASIDCFLSLSDFDIIAAKSSLLRFSMLE